MDRNCEGVSLLRKITMSLSARRAWIEIIDYIIDYATDASLSARRAWIEIRCFGCAVWLLARRSPQGERG